MPELYIALSEAVERYPSLGLMMGASLYGLDVTRDLLCGALLRGVILDPYEIEMRCGGFLKMDALHRTF